MVNGFWWKHRRFEEAADLQMFRCVSLSAVCLLQSVEATETC